jgi:hypothetical protein
MSTKSLAEQARSAENPRDVLLDRAHEIINAVMEGRVNIKLIREYLDAETEIRNMPVIDFFESLDKARNNRRKWGLPRDL